MVELLLRYRAMLRGPEAVRITDYLESQGYVKRATEGLRSRNRWRRADSASLLGRMKSDASVDALVGLMSDDSDDVRMVAARSLAAIGDPGPSMPWPTRSPIPRAGPPPPSRRTSSRWGRPQCRRSSRSREAPTPAGPARTRPR